MSNYVRCKRELRSKQRIACAFAFAWKTNLCILVGSLVRSFVSFPFTLLRFFRLLAFRFPFSHHTFGIGRAVCSLFIWSVSSTIHFKNQACVCVFAMHMPAVKIGIALHLNLCMWRIQCNSHTCSRSCSHSHFHFHSMHTMCSLKCIILEKRHQRHGPFSLFQLNSERSCCCCCLPQKLWIFSFRKYHYELHINALTRTMDKKNR